MSRRQGVPTLIAILLIAIAIPACAVWWFQRSRDPSAGPAANAPCLGTLGVEVSPIAASLRVQLGMPASLTGGRVAEVLPGSPAADAGLRMGDILVRIDEHDLANACEAVRATRGLPCDRDVHVVVWRVGGTKGLAVRAVDEPSLLDAACATGSPAACYRLAWARATVRGGAGETADASDVERACVAGSAEACAARGIALTSAGHPSGIPMLVSACQADHGAGCAQLGYLYATGTLVERNDTIAIRHYERSCEAGDASGCYNVALMYREARGVRADLRRAIETYERACRDGSAPACTDLGYVYERGEGVERDLERAFTLYRLGCDGSACSPSNRLACVNIGRAYRDGLGVPVSAASAAAFFEDACTRPTDPGDVDPAPHQARACSLLGALYLAGTGVAPDASDGLRFSVRGCEAGDAFGCFNAGVVHHTGQGVPVDRAKAREFYSLACDKGDAEACEAARTVGPGQ